MTNTTPSTTPVVKFKKYNRFDAVKAAKGINHAIIDEPGNNYGTFRTSLFDPFSKFIQVETERFHRVNADNVNKTGDNASVFAFVEICVHDWSDVLDENGKPVKFSKELAFAYLIDTDNSWAAMKLISLSQDVLNYQGDPVAKVEEISGN
jgi:hypothetical protein